MTTTRFVIALVLVFSFYHLVRDVMQITGLDNGAKVLFPWWYEWCGQYCNFVRLPLEIGAIAASLVAMRQNYFGVAGVLAISFPIALFLHAFVFMHEWF